MSNEVKKELQEKSKKKSNHSILKLFRNIGLSFLILSPVLITFGFMYMSQFLYPDEKAPFIHWSGHDPKTQAVVTWETKDIETSAVWIGTSATALTLTNVDANLVKIHKILLSGLAPNTLYYYKVGVNGTTPIYRSSVFSFKTAPNNTNTNFSFIAYSDSQQFYGFGWHWRISSAITTHQDISFVTNVGDLAYRWDNKQDWNQYLHEASVYTNKWPFVPCMGNHDGFYPELEDPTGTKHHYRNYFNATVNNSHFYYSFNWSNTLFCVGEISKGGDEDIKLPRNIQHDVWLNETLRKGQDKAFRVLEFHRPIFSAEGDNQPLISRMIPIIEKYNVSVVLYGHHHHYERFYYNGVTYICLGGGGGQQLARNYFKTGLYTKSFAMGPSYTRFYVSSDKISIITYTPDNDILDSCILKLQGSKAVLEV